MQWIKQNKIENDLGTVIYYKAIGKNIAIESRKRHIPHANGIGTWDHTSYFVLVDGNEVVEKHSLRDAKEYAEENYGEED